MKKFAMSVAAASMLLGGLAGCGTADDQATDMNATGTRVQTNDTGFNRGDRYQGQGPLTDMLTPDGRGTNNVARGTRQGLGTAGGGDGFGAQTEGGYGLGTQDSQGAGFARQGRSGLGVGPGALGTQGRTGAGTADGTIRPNEPGMGRAGLEYGTNGARTIQRAHGVENAGITGGNRPGMVDDDGLLRGRARGGVGLGVQQQRQATNYGTQAPTANRQGVMNYHKDYDSETVRKIADRVEDVDGVEDVRVIVHNNDVVVGVQADNDVENVEKKVRQKVQNVVDDNKNVRVVTDNDAVGRIRTMDDQLRSGAAFDEVGATFTEMLRDLGRAAQRPFERTR